ncbi:unnamed protein product, partial [Hapterophycus canaliculatus]
MIDDSLISSAANGNIRRFKSLLSTGVSVDGTPAAHTTPLFVAASLNRVSMMAFLIVEGADLEFSTPREVLDESGNVVVHKGRRPMHAAVLAGDIGPLRLLLKSGANPTPIDAEGRTPLSIVCSLSHHDDKVAPEMVRQLLEAGSDLSMGDSNNLTPLFYAARHGKETIVSLLLSAGARNDGTAGSRACPLVAAVHVDHNDVVRHLVQDNCDAVGGLAAIGMPLRLALHRGRAKVLNLLLSTLASPS